MSDIKMVKVPQDGNMSKVQEIEVITKFMEALPEGSYLASILKGMTRYCTQQIEDDFGISPLDTIEARDEVIEKLRRESAQEIEKVKSGAALQISNQRQTIEEACRLQERNQDEIKKQASRIETLVSNADDMRARWNEEASRARKAEIELGQANAEILRLKAKLFDYMEKEARA